MDAGLSKVIVLGQASAGKTTLLRRFMTGRFHTFPRSTIGVEYVEVGADLTAPHCVRYALWDTGGAERYRCMWNQFYRGAVLALLVYDVTSEDSFQMAWTVWQEEIMRRCPAARVIVVGTKTDLWIHRVIDTEMGARKAEKNGYPFQETSACTGEGVDELFQTVASIVASQQTKSTKRERTLLGRQILFGDDAASKKKEGKCCSV